MLFRRSKTPAELVKLSLEAVAQLDARRDAKAVAKAREELTKHCAAMKALVVGTVEKSEPDPDQVGALGMQFVKQDFVFPLLAHLAELDFECRKDAVVVLRSLISRSSPAREELVAYLEQRPVFVQMLMDGYDNSDVALFCGSLLRECVAHERLAKVVLESPQFFRLFGYVQVTNFDVASDALTVFKDLLTRHKAVCVEFLEKNFDAVFGRFTELLNSNYMSKWQSLKLLGEVLLARTNFSIMTRYIQSVENLKLMMNLLRDESKNIQFEAFHVFKVFVANPAKPDAIRNILVKNKERLIQFLEVFHRDKAEDDQFMEEKRFLIEEISKL